MVRPEKKEDGDIDVVMQNPQFHAITPQKPKSWLHALLKAKRTGKPQRVFVSLDHMKWNEDGTATIEFPLPKEMQLKIKELESQGKKIRIHLPEGGVPIFASADAKEKMASIKRKKKRRKKLKS